MRRSLAPSEIGNRFDSDVHRQRPLREALVDAYRTTMALFDDPTFDGDETGT